MFLIVQELNVSGNPLSQSSLHLVSRLRDAGVACTFDG